MPFICSCGKDWQKSIIQKDILEFLGIFTINDQFIFTINNSIQINIKFTFTVHESIIQFDIYIYIYIYILYIYYIYTIYILYIYKYIYIYLCELCVLCLLQHCCNSNVRGSHWFHIQMIFSSWFY